MGLFGMVARTAVVAGTATALSNNVSRRQANRRQRKADAEAYEQQQAAPAYAPPPEQAYAAPPAQGYPLAAEPPGGALTQQLQQLADLKAQGLLTDQEFEAAKARLLAQ